MPQSHLLSEPGFWHLGSLHPLSHGNVRLVIEEADGLLTNATLDFSRSSRADEKLLEVREVPQGLALAGRSGWLTPAAAEVAYAQALESLMGLQPPPRAEALRQLLLEVQMVIGLSLRLAALAPLCGQPSEPWLELRERWLRLHERMSGARIHDVFVRLGGVANDVEIELISQLIESSQADTPAFELEAAQGHALLPAHLVAEFELTAVPQADNDAAARIEFIASQLKTCLSEVGKRATELPQGEVAQLLPKSIRIPVGSSHAQVRSATGGVNVWVFGDGGKAPARVSYASNSERAVSLFERQSLGMDAESARWLLATLPISPGEVAM